MNTQPSAATLAPTALIDSDHLSTERLRQTMQTDVFIWHGHADIWLNSE